MLGKRNFRFLEEKIREFDKLSDSDKNKIYCSLPDQFDESSLMLKSGVDNFRVGNYSGAILQFEKYAAQCFENPSFICLLSDSYSQIGNQEYSIRILQKYISNKQFDINVHKKLALHLRQAGLITEAVEIYRGILNIVPNDIESMMQLSNFYIIEQCYTEAIKYLNHLLRYFPLDIKYNLVLGLCYVETGKYREAIAVLESIHLRNPNSDEIAASLGGAYFYSGNYQKAIEYYNMAIELDSDKTDNILNLAICYEKTNTIEKAIEILQQIPDNLCDKNIKCTLTRFLIKAGNFICAADEIKLLQKEDPEMATELFENMLLEHSKRTQKTEPTEPKRARTFLRGIEIYVHLKNSGNTYHYINIPGGLNGNPFRDYVESGKWRFENYEISSDKSLYSPDCVEIEKFISFVDAKCKTEPPQSQRPTPLKNEKYYRNLLDVASSSTLSEIKSAYKKKLKLYHPDKVASLGKELQELALSMTKDITEAYDFLKKRKLF